jgi:hypothetical protein
VDGGWLQQTMGAGVKQTMLMSSMRYGLTPKLDLRWGVTNHVTQSGGGTAPLAGTGDQWLMARYRFLEQRPRVPALAFLYGYKVPTANPAKGFGSGFADHQFVFIASRDFGRNHFDFNTVGTVVGGAKGQDGSAQFGLALTRTVTSKLAWVLESYGGPQPGTPDRFGAGFTGASYILRPTLTRTRPERRATRFSSALLTPCGRDFGRFPGDWRLRGCWGDEARPASAQLRRKVVPRGPGEFLALADCLASFPAIYLPV